MKARCAIAAVLALFLLVPAAPARADVVLTPYVGSLFGGDLSGNRAAYGAIGGVHGRRHVRRGIRIQLRTEFVSAGVAMTTSRR